MKRKLISMLLALCLIMSCFAMSRISVSAATAPDATGSIQGGQTIYFQPSTNWKKDNARFALYYFNNSSNQNGWVNATAESGDIYKINIPGGTWEGVIFTRMNPSSSQNNWNNKWNQTADINSIPSGKNLFKCTADSWDDFSGTWSTYTPATTPVETTAAPTTAPVQETTQSASSGTVTVYFTDALNWGGAKLYFWNAGPSWPGTDMEYYETNGYGQKVYKLTIPSEAEGIIFNYNGNQTVDITEGISEGAHWYTTGNKEGNNFKVALTTPVVQPTEAPTEVPTEAPTDPEPEGYQTVYIGMDPVLDPYDTGYRVKYEVVKGSGVYEYAELAPTGKADWVAFGPGYKCSDIPRWFDIYSAEIPAKADVFAVADKAGNVWGGMWVDPFDYNAIYFYQDTDYKGYYQPVVQTFNVNIKALNPHFYDIYVAVQADDNNLMKKVAQGDFKVGYGWDYLPDSPTEGHVSGRTSLTYLTNDFRKLGSDVFGGQYHEYEVFQAKIPVTSEYFYVTDGVNNYNLGYNYAEPYDYNAVYVYNSATAGSTDDHKYLMVDGFTSEMPTEEPTEPVTEEPTEPATEEPTTAPATEPATQPTTPADSEAVDRDGVLVVGDDFTLQLNTAGKTTVTGEIYLAPGQYKFRMQKDRVLMGYGKTISDVTTKGLTYNAKYKAQTTLNAQGGVYKFQFSTTANALVVSKADTAVPAARLTGDLHTILKPVPGNESVAIGSMYIAPGEYKFKIMNGSSECGYNKVINDTTGNAALSVNPKYKADMTLNATGGMYTFKLLTKTNKLSIAYVNDSAEAKDDVHVAGDISFTLMDNDGESDVAVREVTLEAGTYSFKVYNYGIVYTIGGTIKDSATKTLKSSYTTPVTLNATGGTYLFSFNKTNGSLEVTKQ